MPTSNSNNYQLSTFLSDHFGDNLSVIKTMTLWGHLTLNVVVSHSMSHYLSVPVSRSLCFFSLLE